MLVRKKMRAVSQETGSMRAERTSRRERPEEGAEDEAVVVDLGRWAFSGRRRRRATFFWRGVRYRAVCGESGTMCHAARATMMEGNPSTRKSTRHGAMGLASPNLTMSHARLDAKELASGAAEMNMAVRKASSLRL